MEDVSFEPVSTIKTDPEAVTEDTCQQYDDLVNCTTKFVRSLRDKPGSCKKLAKAFPKCYKKDKEAVKTVSTQLWDTFETQLTTDIQKNNEKLKSILVHFSKLAKDSKCTWRPSGDPEKDMEAHFALAKQEELSKLKEILKNEEAEKEILDRELNEKENKVKEMYKNIEIRVKKWEEMRKICDSTIIK